MRGPLYVMRRWWKDAVGGNANGNGHGHANGNGHGKGHTHAGTNGEAVAPPREETMPEPPWLAQLDREGVPRSLHYPSTTLGRILDQAADRYGDRVALVYNRKRWTYRDLLARVNRMAGGLSRSEEHSLNSSHLVISYAVFCLQKKKRIR